MSFNISFNTGNRAEMNSAFTFVDRSGAVQPDLSDDGVQGDLDFGDGTTASGNTGPTVNPAGFNGYIYSEASGGGTPASSTWCMALDAGQPVVAGEEVTIEFQASLDGLAGSELIVEYAPAGTAITGNAGWVNIANIPATDGNGAFVAQSFTFTAITTGSTVFRIRWNTTGNFANDLAVGGTLSIVSVSTVIGAAPEITLSGDANIILQRGDVYTDPGFSAMDAEDGDLTANVVVGGDTVDVDNFGTYEVTYTVTDADSNTVTVSRFVSVSPYLFITDPFVGPFPSGPSTWTLNGNQIVQTGSGTLEGMDAIAGVQLCEIDGKRVYDVQDGNREVIVEGTLFIDPEEEQLLNGYDGTTDLFQVVNNGHLIIGRFIDQNGFRRHSSGTAIDFENTNTVGAFIDRVSFRDNARFDWFGGTIALEGGKFGFYDDNVTVRIYSLEARLIFRTQDVQNQIRQETDDFISEQLDFINGELTIVGVDQQLNGYRPTHCTGALAFSSATPNVDVPIRNYAGGGRGNVIDVKHWQGSRPFLINSETGSDLNTGPHIAGNNLSFGAARVEQEIVVQLQDQANNAIAGASIFIRDANHGNRRTYTQEGNNFNQLADNVYFETTSLGGSSPTLSVRLANCFASQAVGSANDPVNTGRYTWDRRGKTNDGQDLFDIHVWAYEFIYQPFADAVLKGANGLSLSQRMSTDALVTNPDRTAVVAYTVLETPQKAYDYVKQWKLEQANIELPTIETLPLTREGDLIDAGSFDVDLVDTGPPFALAGSTLTINTGPTFTGSIITTGIVTNPDVSVVGLVTDANGQRSTVSIDFTTIVPGSRLLVQALSGGPLAEGSVIFNDIVTGSNESIPFAFAGNQPIIVRVRNSSNEPFYQPFIASGTITSSGFSLSVNQILD